MERMRPDHHRPVVVSGRRLNSGDATLSALSALGLPERDAP